jgi:hypothetical protein
VQTVQTHKRFARQAIPKEPACGMAGFTEQHFLKLSSFLPVFHAPGTLVADKYRPGDPYREVNPGASFDISFNLPANAAIGPDRYAYLYLNHCGTTSGARLNITANASTIVSNYNPPKANFGIESFIIPMTDLNAEEPNAITLQCIGPGPYWLSDVGFDFEDLNHCRVSPLTHRADEPPIGATILHGIRSNFYRPDNPYWILNSGARCSVFFNLPMVYPTGKLALEVNAAGMTDVIVELWVNGTFLTSFNPRLDFNVFSFDVPYASLQFGDLTNQVELAMPAGTATTHIFLLSDINLKFETELPPFTQSNSQTLLQTILLKLRWNNAQLQPYVRDDLAWWQLVQEAPGWWLMPFMPKKISLTEMKVFFDSFPMDKLSDAALKNGDLIQRARAFHSELLATDLPRKNALRHAYWCALMTQAFGVKFAVKVSDAHEYAHVDLTIEGPFDHVTDKINNAVGIIIGTEVRNMDPYAMVDNAWAVGDLAWARDFRYAGETQTATVYWQEPLNRLASRCGVIPNFSDTERATLARMRVTIPQATPIEDKPDL